MSEYNKECYSYIKKLTEELAKDYDLQYQNMEDFARWNMPQEVALEWIDAEGMIDILDGANYISQEAIEKLRLITNRFAIEFKKENNIVWTHEEMRLGTFWNTQRVIAKKLLEIL